MFARQMFLPGLQIDINLGKCRKHNQLGKAGEWYAFTKFLDAGYQVRFLPKMNGGDLALIDENGEIFKVEVKTARQTTDGKWRFLLHKEKNNDHRGSDFVLLIAVNSFGAAYCYLVPTSVLANQNGVAITSDPARYAGKLAQYQTKTFVLKRDTTSIGENEPCHK